ncbi:MAG: hypothetical protein U9Q12_03030 [Patescibacteria group bacterium]|nr:hypothetical protein [Patescibacteria group bacterium]
MGKKQIITIIKNGGVVMVALTFVVGIVYTVLDLHIIVAGGENLIILRLVGVGLIVCIAYLPYYVLQKALLYTKYNTFLLSAGIIFFVGDVIVRFDLIVSFLSIPGFVGVVIYPFLFTAVISFIWLCEVGLRRCKISNQYCHKLSIVMRNKYNAILLKVKKI